MNARALICAVEGESLSGAEAALLKRMDPWAFILFSRNVANPAQLSGLTQDLRALVGRDAPIFIDQEGGRVQRLTAPHWRLWEPPLDFARHLPLAERCDAFVLRYGIIAAELRAVGVDANCTPCLDVARAETHPFLKNRCYSDHPDEVAVIARAILDAQNAQGVLGVVKHMPGHGRALADSHFELPRVHATLEELKADFAPFHSLNDAPLGMTAHIVIDALDAQTPATHSSRVMQFMRDELGFDGLIMTDDISMQALSGDIGARAERSLAAGCDIVLHCNANQAEHEVLAEVVPRLSGQAALRAERALATRDCTAVSPSDVLAEKLSALIGESVGAG